jgi:hypothetical protein
MCTIYLLNILHRFLIYLKYTPSVTIMSRPFMLIIIFEYTYNMVVHIFTKYTFMNNNIPKYIPWNTQNTPFYIHKVVIIGTTTTKFTRFLKPK